MISTCGTLGRQLKQTVSRGTGQDLESLFHDRYSCRPGSPSPSLSHAILFCHEKENRPSRRYFIAAYVLARSFPSSLRADVGVAFVITLEDARDLRMTCGRQVLQLLARLAPTTGRLLLALAGQQHAGPA